MTKNRIRYDSRGNQYTAVVDDKAVRNLNKEPTLKQIREMSREYGPPLERIDVFGSDVVCSKCKGDLIDRFASDMSGNFLCWDCAISSEEDDEQATYPSVDPTKVALSESGLYHKSLCDYVINVATGCSHGCKFCYVPSTPNITARQKMLKERSGVEDGQKEWGSYLLYRDDLPERLRRKLNRKQKWNYTDRGRGVVMLSSGTDCYQDRRTAQITRGCIIELVKHQIPVRILTRSPAVVRDLDVYKAATEKTKEGKLVRVGSSIPSLNEKEVRAIESNAPVPSARLNALQTLSDAGIPVYVSMSPTYPTQSREDLENLISRFAKLDPEVVFHEPINPRGGNFGMTVQAAKDAGVDELAEELEKLRDRNQWVEYSLKHMRWAEELGEEYGVDVHVWPDKQVIKSADQETGRALEKQRKNPSPEQFPEVPLPT